MNPLDTMTTPFEEETAETQDWFDSPRFDGITRLYSARQVVVQRGTIKQDHTVAREAAEQFYVRLRELFDQKKSITTFGPSRSVLLVSRVPVSSIERVALDGESRTSNALAQVLFAEVWGGTPKFEMGPLALDEALKEFDAVVRIGDAFIELKERGDGAPLDDVGISVAAVGPNSAAAVIRLVKRICGT